MIVGVGIEDIEGRSIEFSRPRCPTQKNLCENEHLAEILRGTQAAMGQTDQRVSKKRWIEGGWDSQTAAADFYRRAWQAALSAGVKPGERIQHFIANVQWLVEGHPRYAEMSEYGVSYFTVRPDGRGNHRFVLVDNYGNEHPFSTNVALTGFEHPLSEPIEDDAPFDGMTS